jgi:hypothetical protein
MRFPKLLCREVRKAMQKEGLNLICPQQIHDLFMGQNRICKQASAAHQQEKNNRCRAERRKAPGHDEPIFQCLWQRSNPAKQQEDQYDHENQSHPSGRIIAPVSAMRPCGNRTNQYQHQNHDQGNSKHTCSSITSSSGDQVDDKNDQRYDQNNVNQAAGYMEAEPQ